MSSVLPLAELHPAFVWDCDGCGQENFCRGIDGQVDIDLLEMNEEHVAEYVASDEWTQGDDDHCETQFLIQQVVLTPKTVKCYSCGSEFKPEIPKCEEDD